MIIHFRGDTELNEAENNERSGQRGRILNSVEESIKPRRWTLLGMLAVAAMLTVLYIYNVYAVNDLLRDIRKLEKKHEQLRAKNDVLAAKAVRLQSADRIIKIARENLNMKRPESPPEILK